LGDKLIFPVMQYPCLEAIANTCVTDNEL